MVTISEIGRRLRAREVSVREVVEESLRAVARENPRLNAFITVTEEAARARAVELDAMLGCGVSLGPLHGVPIAHKDCILTRGVRTTGGSKILANYIPRRDADVVERLHAAGAVMIGKTGLHELTYGITNVNPHYGPVRNPHDVTRVSGGSSGGSGAAVAAGMVAMATGTDTGGSIRIPASFCGCVGLKPTYDAVSRKGVMPLGPSQDHVGPMTATVGDAALAFEAMGGRVLESTGPVPVRVGVPANHFFDGLDAEVHAAVQRGAVQVGAHEVHLPDVEPLMEIARVTLLSEAAEVLGRYAKNPTDVGADVWALLEKGRVITAAEYLDAQRRRKKLAREFARIWKDCDCLLTPATPFPAFPIEHDSDLRPAATRLTRPFNLLGWPALAMPCGMTKAGLPIGLQLIAAPGREDILFAVGVRLEGNA
jgi:aspartyl-tRNA(Asn)/glutamyl-tRNA(Gln) amidotransferase subunit A